MGKPEELLSLLQDRKARRVGIVCHKNADPDSFCSAYALSLLLQQFDIESSIIAPEGISEVSKHLFPKFDCRISSSEAAKEAQVLILVDVCSLDQIGEVAEIIVRLNLPVIVVDHHAETASLSEVAVLKFIDESAVSVGELVYQLYSAGGKTPSGDAATAMLAAIIYDSRHLMRATPRTLEIVLALLATGINYSDVVQSLRVPVDASERIARLKAAQRVNFEKVGEFLIATTHVGSFEASAARALLDLGADVAIVVGGDGRDLRISGRARDEFYARTRLHLGSDLFEKLGAQIGGGGGGHPTAAGASGRGDPERVASECGRLLREAILATPTKK